jgi:hypothetical protein
MISPAPAIPTAEPVAVAQEPQKKPARAGAGLDRVDRADDRDAVYGFDRGRADRGAAQPRAIEMPNGLCFHWLILH